MPGLTDEPALNDPTMVGIRMFVPFISLLSCWSSARATGKALLATFSLVGIPWRLLRRWNKSPGSRRRLSWTRKRLVCLLVLTAMVLLASVMLWQFARLCGDPTLKWTAYDSLTLAHCRETGRLAVVVYYFPWSTTETVWAFCPFDDPQIVKSLNDARAATMATWPPWPTDDNVALDDNAVLCESEAAQADSKALNATGDDLPLIVIYDSRRGDLVVRAIRETRDQRAHRVGGLIRDHMAVE